MNTKKLLTLLVLGILCIVVIVILIGTQQSKEAIPESSDTVEQQAGQARQYEGVVVSVSQDGDLLHILESEQGLTVVRVSADLISEVSDLGDGDRVVIVATSDIQDPQPLRLQRVVSFVSGDELTPEENMRLNSEFTDLRL